MLLSRELWALSCHPLRSFDVSDTKKNGLLGEAWILVMTPVAEDTAAGSCVTRA